MVFKWPKRKNALSERSEVDAFLRFKVNLGHKPKFTRSPLSEVHSSSGWTFPPRNANGGGYSAAKPPPFAFL